MFYSLFHIFSALFTNHFEFASTDLKIFIKYIKISHYFKITFEMCGTSCGFRHSVPNSLYSSVLSRKTDVCDSVLTFSAQPSVANFCGVRGKNARSLNTSCHKEE